MNILALIPARMGSSRFPGKPMALILGKPMIGHVYERVSKSPVLMTTAVATCDQEIFNYIESIGGVAVMTANTYDRASDRCAEALLKLEAESNIRYDIVVMVQGDEPMTHPNMILEAVQPMLDDASIDVVNLLNKSDNNIISTGFVINTITNVTIAHILFSFKNSNIYPTIILSFMLFLFSFTLSQYSIPKISKIYYVYNIF